MSAESLAAEGLQFLEKYFRETEFALTRHHIDSYEQCVFDEIPTIIHSQNPIVFLKTPLDEKEGVFATRVELYIGGQAATPAELGISLSPPVITLDGGNTVRRMLPNEARLRGTTYAVQVNADIQVRATLTKQKEGAPPGTWETEMIEAPLIRAFPLFKLPILLRSRLCPTGVANAARLEDMGECRNDYGGYFIINGAEKVLITRGEQAFNSLYVEKKPQLTDDKNAAYASVVSLHPETKQTRRTALYMLRKGAVKGAGGGEIRVAIPMVRGTFPLFVLFRALGVESDEEIVRMVFPDAADPLADDLIPSIVDAHPIYNKYTAIKFIKTLTKGFSEAHVLDILNNLLLAHVPNVPLARAQYLAEMTRAVIEVNRGIRTKTDRDDMRNQRFLTTGVLVRELFNACWKEWRGNTITTIDRAYRDNEGLYQGKAVFDLFTPGSLAELFQPAELNRAIMRGFGGRWGTNEMNIKTGVLQPLARISYLDATSHQRRVVSDFDTGMKTTGPRKLHTSQVGYFCTSETPQGAHIGATKNMSMLTQFSLGAALKPVYDWMMTKGGVMPVAATTAAQRASAAIVQINGGTVGFTATPLELTRTLRLMKWTACLSPTASVAFNALDKTVRVYLDEGRPLRPLWHLNGEGAGFLTRLPALRSAPWRDLVFGTLAATADATMRTVRFLDPLADQPAATFADYETLLAPAAGFIEWCDPMEMNEAYISWWGGAEELTPAHTHCEIHPSTLTGLMASMIPYSNHNQAPRNQLSNSQSKQGIGYMATNIKNRYDTYSHQLCYGEAPLCRTFAYETVGNGEMAYGFNCMIAATSESGYNQDDGLIVNRDSVARGMFQSLAFRSYDCAEEVDTKVGTHSHVANPRTVPLWTALRPGMDYSKLDERGIIREGELIDDTTVLVGRYMVLSKTNEVKDASVGPGLYTKGRVDSVVVLHQAEGRLLVKVRILEMRMPGLGDKFSTRHGQKGTMGMLVSAADLPRTADGIVPDIMVNPGGLISRMTVAQLVEMVAGRLGADVAAKMNATTFCNGGDFVKQLGDVLQELGASRAGDNVMYSGITGAQIKTDIFMCPLYFMRLKHLTEDKVNSRGAGKRELRTHQPTGGRANEGGLRIGEMERDTLCVHGVSLFLDESMMKRGDATEFWICRGCGRIPIYNEPEGLFVCPTCDGPLNFVGERENQTLQLPTKQSRASFTKIAMPYALKLLDQELTTFANVGFRFMPESSIAQLRDTDLPWPVAEFGEFEAVGRDVSGAIAAQEEERDAAIAAAAAAAAGGNDEADGEDGYAAAMGGLRTAVGTAVAGLRAGAAPGAEGAAAVLKVADAAGGAAAATDPMTIRFYSKLKNEFLGFSNFASAPFSITRTQLPGPGGVAYPPFNAPRVGSSGSIGVVGSGPSETWPTVEHYYQAMKFPADPAWQEAIRSAPTPARAKKMGLSREHPARGDWDTIKEQVMKAALMSKFSQNSGLLALLQGTGERPLVEASPGDSYWSAGRNGKGKNRLGALLTEVRRELADVRVDQSVFASEGPATVVRTGDEPEDSEAEDAAANLVQEASEVVAAATNGAVQVGAPGGGQVGGAAAAPNGVYMFINPQIGGFHEQARVQRARSRPSRRVQWEGMAVSRDGDGPQEGGGPVEEMTRENGSGGGDTEITVQKLG
jgi:DNA-directed RNA polymerase II subunit RPB2